MITATDIAMTSPAFALPYVLAVCAWWLLLIPLATFPFVAWAGGAALRLMLAEVREL